MLVRWWPVACNGPMPQRRQRSKIKAKMFYAAYTGRCLLCVGTMLFGKEDETKQKNKQIVYGIALFGWRDRDQA